MASLREIQNRIEKLEKATIPDSKVSVVFFSFITSGESQEQHDARVKGLSSDPDFYCARNPGEDIEAFHKRAVALARKLPRPPNCGICLYEDIEERPEDQQQEEQRPKPMPQRAQAVESKSIPKRVVALGPQLGEPEGGEDLSLLGSIR